METLIRTKPQIAWRMEWQPEMAFVGFTTTSGIDVEAFQATQPDDVRVVRSSRRDVWICLVPCVALHVVWHGPEVLDEDSYPF